MLGLTLRTQNSIVVIPKSHQMWHSQKMVKRHGKIYRHGLGPALVGVEGCTDGLVLRPNIVEEKPIKLLLKAMPGIQQFIKEKLGRPSRQ